MSHAKPVGLHWMLRPKVYTTDITCNMKIEVFEYTENMQKTKTSGYEKILQQLFYITVAVTCNPWQINTANAPNP